MIDVVCECEGQLFRVVQQEKADNPRSGVLFKVFREDTRQELGDFVALRPDEKWQAFPDVEDRAHLKQVAFAASELMKEVNANRLAIE